MRTGRSRSMLFSALVGVVGCAPAPRGMIFETIARRERPRGYASPTAYEAYLRAEVAIDHRDLEAAARQLDLAEIADPEDAYLPARHAEVLLRTGDLPGADRMAREAVRMHPNDGAAWIALAEVCSQRGDTAGAMAAAAHAVALDPDDPDARGAAAAVAGGTARDIANARDSSTGRSAEDSASSWGAVLAPSGDPRRTGRAHARETARAFWSRGQWSEVDRVLSPWVDRDPEDLVDRVRVIEARVRDGRPQDAAHLVSGVSLGEGIHALVAPIHARLWLLVERPELARDEAQQAVTADPGDQRSALVLGEALVALGGASRSRGLTVLARIPVGTDPYAQARIAAAETLAQAEQPDAADAVLAGAVAGASGAEGRDRVRVARARLRVRRGPVGEARSVLEGIETAWGRHRRAELEDQIAVAGITLGDLRARTGEHYEDAVADGLVVLVCSQHPGTCTPEDTAAAMDNARRGAPAAPTTLRAMASMEVDRGRSATDSHRMGAPNAGGSSPGVLSGSLGSGEHPRSP